MDIKPFENKVWLSSPTMHGDELKYVTEAYETNWMSTVGENINEVERQMAEKIGCGYAVALSCGTSALHLAMKLAGINPGDEVLCSDMTFDATVNPVVYEGGMATAADYGDYLLAEGRVIREEYDDLQAQAKMLLEAAR